MTLLSMLDRFEQAAVTYETSTDKADRDELHAARRAIMEAFEARSASAEPVAYIDTSGKVSVVEGSPLPAMVRALPKPAVGKALLPLYASPPASKREAELVKALTPFEEIADEGNEDQPDETPCVIKAGRSIDYTTTLGDFRRLRAAIDPSLEQEPAK